MYNIEILNVSIVLTCKYKRFISDVYSWCVVNCIQIAVCIYKQVQIINVTHKKIWMWNWMWNECEIEWIEKECETL